MDMIVKPGERRWYNPDRDFAYNFPGLLKQTAERVLSHNWVLAHDLAASEGVTDEDMEAAVAALCQFGAKVRDGDFDTMSKLLDKCGWNKIPEAAQMVVAAQMGAILMGYYYCSIREAIIEGGDPTDTLSKLRDYGAEAARNHFGQRGLRAWTRRLLLRFFRWWPARKGKVTKDEEGKVHQGSTLSANGDSAEEKISQQG